MVLPFAGSVASSRAATAASPRDGGKSQEKLFERLSGFQIVERVWIGTRVPRNTGVPPRISGSLMMTPMNEFYHA